MSRKWRPLPKSLPPEAAYLVTVLRELMDRLDHSLSELAARTPYSRSSWDRYLNGAQLPPRDAVEALGQLAGEYPKRLVLLWERAEAQVSRRAAVASPRSDAPAPEAGTRYGTDSGRDAEPNPVTDTATTDTASQRQPAPVGGPPPTTRSTERRRGRARGALTLVLIVAVAMAWLDTGASVTGELPLPAASSQASGGLPLTVGCRGAQCTGQNAYDTACDVDAAIYAGLQVNGAYLELNVSGNCAAAWADISRPGVGDEVSVESRSGLRQTSTVHDKRSATGWVATPMLGISSPDWARACWRSRAGEPRCTPWGDRTPTAVPAPNLGGALGNRGPAGIRRDEFSHRWRTSPDNLASHQTYHGPRSERRDEVCVTGVGSEPMGRLRIPPCTGSRAGKTAGDSRGQR
jgi:hypothetical protein